MQELVHLVYELNERVNRGSSRRSKASNDVQHGSNSDILSHRITSALNGLLKKISEYNSRFSDMEASDASMDGSLIKSSVLVNKLSNELRVRERELDSMRRLLHDNESSLKHEAQKSARSAILREQLAISVTNSICAGYLDVHMIGGSGPSLPERRFVSLNFTDLRIYDYTLSAIAYRLVNCEYDINISEQGTVAEYRWGHKLSGRRFLFLVRTSQAVLPKWSHAMSTIRESMVNRSLGFGPAFSYSYPEGVVLFDNGSTITDLDSST